MNKWLEWDIELVWFKWIENEWERERGRKEAYTLGMLLQRERERERERERKKERKESRLIGGCERAVGQLRVKSYFLKTAKNTL